jgi:hypothetical protein
MQIAEALAEANCTGSRSHSILRVLAALRIFRSARPDLCNGGTRPAQIEVNNTPEERDACGQVT